VDFSAWLRPRAVLLLGETLLEKVENGIAVLLGVTVVTVTPLSPREYPLDILASDRRSLYPYS